MKIEKTGTNKFTVNADAPLEARIAALESKQALLVKAVDETKLTNQELEALTKATSVEVVALK